MNDLIALAETIAARLKARRESIAIAEFDRRPDLGGATRAARCVGLFPRRRGRLHPSGEDIAARPRRSRTHAISAGDRAARSVACARRAGTLRGSSGLGETGATGPIGNRYGDPAGHTCLAVAGTVERAITLETGRAERLANMHAFAAAALRLLADTIPQ